VCFYWRAFNVESQERLTIESALRRAVAENAFELHYQPRISASTGQIVGAEALLRWRDKEHG
jgi:sensor c-di-GMP phosphodiesterase-like protein